MRSKIFLGVFILLTIIYLQSCDTKDEDNFSEKKESEKNQTQQNPPEVKMSNPSTETGKIWIQIEKVNISIAKNVNSGKSGHLEEPVAEILELLKSLAEKAPDIKAADLEAFKSKVNELRKIGVRLDQYQHANKHEELKSEYEKFAAMINNIKVLIP